VGVIEWSARTNPSTEYLLLPVRRAPSIPYKHFAYQLQILVPWIGVMGAMQVHHRQIKSTDMPEPTPGQTGSTSYWITVAQLDVNNYNSKNYRTEFDTCL
jgi:hypothetical protein